MRGKKAKALRKAARELTAELNLIQKANAKDGQPAHILDDIALEDTKPLRKVVRFIAPLEVPTGETKTETVKEVNENGEEVDVVKEVPVVNVIRRHLKGNPFRSQNSGTPSASVVEIKPRVLADCTRKMYQQSKKSYREVSHA